MEVNEKLMKQKAPRKPGRPVDPHTAERILDAARQLVFSEGLQAVSMERVAQEAGVSKVTLYTRFANRNELLSALVATHVDAIYQVLGAVPVNREGLHSGLATFARAMKRFIYGDDYRQLVMVLGSIPQTNQDLCALYTNGPAKTHQVLADYLAAADQRGLIRCPHPVESAEMLIGMICGLDLLRLTYRVEVETPSREQITDFAQRVVDAFMTMHAAEWP